LERLILEKGDPISNFCMGLISSAALTSMKLGPENIDGQISEALSSQHSQKI
jgi:hypothetical protein